MKIPVFDPLKGEVRPLTYDKFLRCQRRGTVRAREDGSYEFCGKEHERIQRKQSRRGPGKQTMAITPARPGGSKQSFEQGLKTGRVWALKGVVGS